MDDGQVGVDPALPRVVVDRRVVDQDVPAAVWDRPVKGLRVGSRTRARHAQRSSGQITRPPRRAGQSRTTGFSDSLRAVSVRPPARYERTASTGSALGETAGSDRPDRRDGRGSGADRRDDAKTSSGRSRARPCGGTGTARPGEPREETPDVEVLDAVLAVDIVLRRTLAECDAEQPVAVAPPGRGLALYEAGEVAEGELAEAGEIGAGDRLARALSHPARD
jgi:hypothetical protein